MIFLASRGLGSVRKLMLGGLSTKVCDLADTTYVPVK
jgi:nucleotide-binding universal stress UspA family protein